jgi:hypothetical protein
MVASYIIWYIVVGNAAGVIVFLWLWMLIGFYALLKFPKFVVVGKLHILTTTATDQQLIHYHQLSSP